MTYDILVLGGGSGGLAAAKAAAKHGAKVAIAEPKALGGTCVNRGCVPKKLMVYAADFAKQQQEAKAYGWKEVGGSFEWETFKPAMHDRIQTLRQIQEKSLRELNIDLLPHSASFVGPNTVQVGDRQVEATNIIIAVGGRPVMLDFPGADLALTSKDMFQLEKLPQRFAVIGGGYIGVEFGHFLAQMGSQVTIVDKNPHILDGFEEDLRIFVEENFDRLGITFLPETSCEEIKKQKESLTMTLTGKCAQTLSADTVLMAVGRAPNFDQLNIEKAGIELKDGQLTVDEHYRTAQPSIFAIGDCIGRLPLTPVAIAEGEAVVKTICQKQPSQVAYQWIPSAVFSAPPVATVGWSESEAREHLGDDVEAIANSFTPLDQSLQQFSQEFLIKAVLQKSSGKIVGLHFAGNEAPELLQGIIPALKNGLTHDELIATIGIHPTSAEEIFGLA
ncbi:dihydrolipoyl dehydrogenase family protein [Vacuolonema iberomarrocanum]|uniref:dihydrolipoyl dehydrogenase family protein n=1 Tax=Vacuolonema iberomarrocanum TaxID=3454632 RepID=UPI001A06E777|nr:FAD-dependent oxidoreductase [filamentous cyanobacterium LEGE 07170]